MTKVSTIGKSCNITTGKLDANCAVNGGEYPFFTCSALPAAINNYAFDDDVVLIAGNNAQGNFHVSRYKGKFNAYQRTYVLTAKLGYSLDYIYYFLKLELKRLKEHSQGSQTKFLTKPILTNIVLRNLDYGEQQQIAAVLSSIDQKIEINNRINAELEAMAKTLYDYWFVQFDFPDENGKPYKSSGGKMVYSKELKREIPAGWSIVPIEYYADIIDPHPSHRAPEETQVGFPFAGIGDIDSEGNISIDKARVIAEDFVLKQEGDYEINQYSLGYGRVGTVGKVVKLRKQKFRYALSPTLAVINPKESKHAGYVYRCVKDKIFFQNVLKNTSGTTRPAIGIQQLRKIPVLKPGIAHNAMFAEFENFTKVLFDKSSKINMESQSLIELRDWLLPMLMNGQVRVGIVQF